jgi:hypothetical protein
MVRGIGLAVACYGALLILINAGVGLRDSAPTAGTLVIAILLILAPAGLALPAGQALAAPLWAWEAIVSWAALGTLLLLVDPRGLGRTSALLLLLAPLVGACASPTLLVAAWCSPRHAVALRRCGYGVAAFPAGLLALAAVDALTPLTAILVGLLFVAGGFLCYTAGAFADRAAPVPMAAPAPLGADEGVPEADTRPPAHPVIVFAGRGRPD